MIYQGDKTKMTNTTILMVEDEAELSKLSRYILTKEGYTILEASDGQQAVELYTQFHHKIHIVLMDLGLPKLDGKEVFGKLREINPEVKVIFMSGYMDECLASELIKAGGKALIQKPYSPDTMLQNLRAVLHGRK